jgi:hypothetical protein
MDAKQDEKVKLAVQFLLLADKSSHNMSVKEAMKLAGYDEKEIQCSTRAKEARVRRAYNGAKKNNTVSIDLPVKEINMNRDFPISPLSEMQSAPSGAETLLTSKSVIRTTSNKNVPGMKIIRQTSHQAHAMHQNAFVLKALRNKALKEATTAWVEASELEKRGEPHKTKKEIIETINNKPQYKGLVHVSDRTTRSLVQQGIIGVSPPRRGNPGTIPPMVYKALKDALTSFICIHQASGKNEFRRSNLSKIVNDVINSNPAENRRSDQLMARLQKDFGPEINLGKSEMTEERRVKWTTYQNLVSWGDNAKEILVELGFGCHSTPDDNVPGEIYFFEGQLDRILNFDETRITLDQTDVQRGGRPSFVFFDPRKPRPGSSTNKSSLSLTVIVGGTAAGEMIPPHFQLTTDSQNAEMQVWNTSIIKYMHDVYGKFGSDDEKYHPCTFGMNPKGGMNKEEFEDYVKNSLVTLFPDAADTPRKRVLLKADSGPGRKNTELMAYLRVRGFYFIPGLPNSTHVTQEMELLIGELKSVFHSNLEKLTRGYLMRHRPIPSGAEIIGLLLFGGSFNYNEAVIDQQIDEKFINAFQVAGNKEKVRGYFEKIGFAPFTRNYLDNKRVRHDSANDPFAEEYDDLEYHNTLACSILDVFGYNGSLLLAKINRKSREAIEQQPHTRPFTLERAKALAGAVTHGQHFKVTGGHHLTSDDFMMADALGCLEKEQKAMTAERKARQKQQQQYEGALPLLEKPENSLLAKDLDILLRFKLGELPGNLKTKAEKLCKWREIKDQPSLMLEPWTNEDEQRYNELMAKQVNLADTALGRQKEILRKQVISSVKTMTEEERRELRKVLDDQDAAV